MSGAAQSITIGDTSSRGAPLIYVNDAFAALTGYPAEEILGRTCAFLQGPDTDRETAAEMRSAVAESLFEKLPQGRDGLLERG